MEAEIAAPSRSNGVGLSEQELKEVLEYEKILRLRDEIYAGTHPTLKVSTHAAPKAAQRQAQSSAVSIPRPVNGEVSKVPQPSPSSAVENASDRAKYARGDSGGIVASTPRTTMSGAGSSGLDPIFLTKSDDLVRAEIQLQRQRIERALEEQVHHNRVFSRQANSDKEAMPDFNVSEVFVKALDIVKPTSFAENIGANATTASSDSFDENTFYSSQMDDSPLEEGDEASESPQKELQGQPTQTSRVEAQPPAGPRAWLLQQKEDHPDKPAPEENRVNGLQEGRHTPLDNGTAVRPLESHQDIRKGSEPREEPEYSPPAADDCIFFEDFGQAAPVNGSNGAERQISHRRFKRSKKSKGRPGGHHKGQNISRPASPPSTGVRVVKSHITSPVAPQPARVSPLAVTKVPQISQAGNFKQATKPSPQHRKRRRGSDGDKTPQTTARTVGLSPDRSIKSESISPVPLSAVPPAVPGQRRRAVSKPILIGTESPRETYRGAAHQRHIRQSSGTHTHRLASPRSSSTRRFPAQIIHEPRAEEPNLRRVTSVQYGVHPQSPSLQPLQYAPVEVPQTRQSSHAYIEREPISEPYHYYRETNPPRSHYIRSERSLSPRPRRAYAEVEHTAPIMAPPPPRRIVVDQYGNRYYEAPRTASVRASVAPPARYAEVGPVYERGPISQIAAYPTMTVHEPYEEARFGQRPIRASPVATRFLRHEPEGGEQYRAYREVEYPGDVIVQRNATIPIADHAGVRHASHFEEPPPIMREPIRRMQSVRPLGSRYEVGEDYAPRLASVRPEQQDMVRMPPRQELLPARVREVSVRVDEHPPSHRRMMTSERPAYEYEAPASARRLIDRDGRSEVIMLDSPVGNDGGAPRRY